MPGSRSAGAGGCPHRAVADRGCCRSSLHFSCSFPTAVTDELSQAREGAVGSDAVMFELVGHPVRRAAHSGQCVQLELGVHVHVVVEDRCGDRDRKSTRLNSSHVAISYAVFCLKKKKRTSS